MAYVSDESDGPQIYVQSLPMLTGKFQISTDGGAQPRWRRDGKELDNVQTVAKERFVKYLGSLDEVTMRTIGRKLILVLGLEDAG
jgi:mRNA-degrading endonuclease toxin of MazEF toxin-antitoxin module